MNENVKELQAAIWYYVQKINSPELLKRLLYVLKGFIGGESMNLEEYDRREILRMIQEIDSISFLSRIYSFIRSKYDRREQKQNGQT